MFLEYICIFQYTLHVYFSYKYTPMHHEINKIHNLLYCLGYALSYYAKTLWIVF
jgi:hypothetical protein